MAVHPSDHVKGGARLAAQGHLQDVLLDASLHGLAQFALNLEEPIGRAESFDALVRALMVVMFDPELDALAGGVEALELRPGEEVLPDGGPEALNLSQRHGMLGPGLDMGHSVLLQFGLETRSAAPTGILSAVIRQHLFGRLKLRHRLAIDFNDRFGGRTAE